MVFDNRVVAFLIVDSATVQETAQIYFSDTMSRTEAVNFVSQMPLMCSDNYEFVVMIEDHRIHVF